MNIRIEAGEAGAAKRQTLTFQTRFTLGNFADGDYMS